MLLTQELVHGVDVWINTPRRPWEACGTSGMKVLVNGGMNLSELDGWWAEAYSPEVGWAIGDGKEHGEDQAWDATEADELYSVLEREVIPQFYERNESGMPAKWLGRIRESMAQLTPTFSATRAIREYTEGHYLPAASGYRDRAAGEGAQGNSLIQWQTVCTGRGLFQSEAPGLLRCARSFRCNYNMKSPPNISQQGGAAGVSPELHCQLPTPAELTHQECFSRQKQDRSSEMGFSSRGREVGNAEVSDASPGA
jgi:hypothetical protein